MPPALSPATAILDARGLRWGDAVKQMQAEPVHREPMLGTWRTVCQRLRQRPGDLRSWELGFVTDLPRFRRLSVKQRYCLNEIARRVLGESATDYKE